ncbi:MAG TPA: aldo/keto reductase family protein [Actinomycetota bacterium]|jgi:aryl-alcohol dehydrogenase-like predicted oxidoreductase|nr:aldo/keto reductase family protein [Actinomycetota bacterium]
MEYRHLGASGVMVSEIALGNWVTHGGQVGAEAAQKSVRAALDAGINFFDTADIYEYGAAEEILGRALEAVPRHTYVVATKVFNAMSDDVNDRGLSRKHIMHSIDDSLRRLQTDYVDLYQAHRFDPNVPLYETLRAWDDLVRAGKVLYVGVSEWDAAQIKRALQIADEMGFDRIVTNQPQYSMLWRVPEEEVMPLCRKEGIGQIVWSPLAMGVLTGKYEPGRPPPSDSRAAYGHGVRRKYLETRTLEAVQNLKPLAADAGLSMAQLALAWVLQNDNVSAAIIGASRPEQVEDNAGAAGVKLEDDLMERIDEVLAGCVVSDPSLTGR